MRHPFQVCLLLICALGWSSGLHGQQAPGFRALDDALVAMMREDSVVGGAAVLVRDGRMVAHAEHGWSDRGTGVRLGPEAIFHWGSITKTLTAVAIMQLRDRGKLTLDDPITRWVPELRQVHNPYGSMDAITLRMLLSHSSGFQNPTWPYRQYVAWEPFEPTRWEQLVSMMPYQQILFPPGSRFSYSNPAFIYLARVIESITGDPYQSYIYKNIWLPLGMRRSYFGATPYNLAPFRSNNYTLVRDSVGTARMEDNGREFDPGITIPNGGWNAPMSDLAIWLSFLSGSSSNDTVLSRRSLEEMWVPQVSAGEAGGGPQSMGLSFFLLDRGETKLVGHTGEQAGFRSLAFFDPVRHAGVIVCVNTTNEAQPDSSGRAFDRVLTAAVRVLAP
ncbi:MAG TPA: serine hydrolase domain-containing protein [Gemmatimonadales bacterium]|nr:serine hydrolase domain-containing protein [Gemmatimonadales bacterium]